MTVRRRITGGFFTGLILLMTYAAALYASAWYHRWRAEQLMRVVKTFQLGVTTQAEYENRLHPLLPYTIKLYSTKGGHDVEEQDAFAIGNQSEWAAKAYRWLPSAISGWLTYWPVTEGINFWVEPTFENNRLSAIDIYEWHGNGHPGGGHVEVRAGRVDHWFGWPDREFNGYEAQQRQSDGVPWSSIVRMDSRATTEQRRRAMDFKFECFTAFRYCQDGRRILDPVITE